ncbi:uncharacterized protein LOC110181493 [Drosophila serrata]|uniref:uncharacterized protein LOC110181493 n=1 Tax=Drosophila serrata TaxID=7274 RepID=UPI000A1D152C|nr:uncharacterized protein LOC110181493 [Drosophila serrata]XP_020804916.1 uncharacterized protein LOC110181493 [Drosophila serrata]XP_020804917.1 uncharacterized protein LOC110181493 [Drosophila serrata]XP_020804918.1 uncharacterized protein LOC110181493 [Drosophila serrata]XP_020804919.1 uncharacterized protein LOC110181493 [Drosophila serrata]
MRNIRNLKDPTVWTKWMQIHFHLHLLLIIILLSFIDSTKAAELTKVSCSSGGSTTITCDCNNIDQPMVLPFLHGDVSLVEIRHCPDLVVEANCLGDTIGLRKVSFNQVGKLVLRQSALSVPRYASNKALIVEFEQTNIKLIESHAITGNIEEISFVGGRIDEMKPFGFTTTKNSAILLKLDGVTIQHIESQAFKKFAVEQMSIANCQFLGDLPTRAFYELEVLNELSLRGNHFHQEVHSHAFSFKLVSKLSLSENHFVAVDGEWLEAQIRDAVTLRGNDFGATSEIAFRSLTVHRSYQLSERLELRFHNNTLRSSRPGADPKAEDDDPATQPQPLRFDERFALSIRELRYDNPWSCDQLDRNVEPPLPKAEFFRLHSDQLMFQPPGQRLVQQQQAPPLLPLRLLISDQCRQQSYTAYIVAGSVILGLLLLLLSLLLWWRIVQKRRRRKLDVVQPEPRTYKETQIVYQIENAGLLKTDL